MISDIKPEILLLQAPEQVEPSLNGSLLEEEALEILQESAELEFTDISGNLGLGLGLDLTEVESIPAALCDERFIQEVRAIPNKMGFKIGDVAEILGIKQYVLRYWETEFDILKPKKAANKQRYYTRKDVENALLIRKLLHRDRFSIEGARSALKSLKSHVKKETKREETQQGHRMELSSLRHEFLTIRSDIARLRLIFN